jgi:hypothetical protein
MRNVLLTALTIAGLFVLIRHRRHVTHDDRRSEMFEWWEPTDV